MEVRRNESAEVYEHFKEIFEYCLDSTTGQDKEIHAEEAWPVWRLLGRIRREINPNCSGIIPNPQTKRCKNCREQGYNTELCELTKGIEDEIDECLLDNA